jgi:hypothetical protein
MMKHVRGISVDRPDTDFRDLFTGVSDANQVEYGAKLTSKLVDIACKAGMVITISSNTLRANKGLAHIVQFVYTMPVSLGRARSAPGGCGYQAARPTARAKGRLHRFRCDCRRPRPIRA